jgi:hypothetical protein
LNRQAAKDAKRDKVTKWNSLRFLGALGALGGSIFSSGAQS